MADALSRCAFYKGDWPEKTQQEHEQVVEAIQLAIAAVSVDAEN